ncbi:MAG: PspC domain-containing protein [Deinococcales bacterium]
MAQIKKFQRNTKDRMIGGVCAGIANYYNLDPTVIRIVWLILFLMAGIGALAYIILWIVMPAK